MFLVGFGKTSIWGTFETKNRLVDELNVRTFCVSDGVNVSVIAVSDMGTMWLKTADRLRRDISRQLGIPLSACAVFSTQNHAIPNDGDGIFDAGRLSEAFVSAAKEAFSGMKSAEMAFVAATPDPPIAFTRRILYRDLGALSFWNGFRDIGGRPDISHTLKININTFCDGEPQQQQHGFPVVGPLKTAYKVPEPPVKVKSPWFLTKPADGLLQGVFFREAFSKRPIGSIVRIAAHPAASNKWGGKICSGDYPHYACREAERLFGGKSLFLQGPCGNQVPLLTKKSPALAQKIGKQVTTRIFAGLKSARWETPGGPVRSVIERAVFSFRNDFPKTRREIQQEQHRLAERMLALAQKPGNMKKVKKLTDRYETLTYIAEAWKEWTGLDGLKYRGKKVPRDMFGLRLGEYALLGLPGEPFGNYSAMLRNLTIGKNLITIEECNGYLSYFPLRKDWPLGSYEVNAAMFDDSSEKVLMTTGLKIMKRLGF